MGWFEITDYAMQTKDLDSRQTLKYYFQAWNEKNLPKMAAACPKSRGITCELEKLNYVKLISIEPDAVYPLHESFKNAYKVGIYRVVFEINIKGGYVAGFKGGQIIWFLR